MTRRDQVKAAVTKPDFYRVHFWVENDRSMRSTTRDDPDLNVIDIEIFSHNGIQRARFRRQKDEKAHLFLLHLEQIETLMAAAFDQGQKHRAQIIKSALEYRL